MTPAQQLLEHCRAATTQLSILGTDADADSRPGSSVLLDDCAAEHIAVFRQQARLVLALDRGGNDVDGAVNADTIVRRLDELITATNRMFYAVPPDEVRLGWREMFAAAHAVKFHLGLLRSHLLSAMDRTDMDDGGELADKEVNELVAVLDRGLIVSGGPGDVVGRVWVNEALDLLERVWEDFLSRLRPGHRAGGPAAAAAAVPSSQSSQSSPPPSTNRITATKPIPRLPGMQLHQFEAHIRHSGTPLVFTDLMTTWPALTTRSWLSTAYLLSQTFSGRRLVPVELGRSYLDDGWTQEIMPLREFIARWTGGKDGMEETAGEDEKDAVSRSSRSRRTVGYLAQHNLFGQIPSLARDIITPDLCFADPQRHGNGRGKLALPLRNAWFGPAGTVTPLHTDPYENLLCQVVGEKYVRLYGPDKGGAMRATGNTAGVDVGAVEGWDGDGDGDAGRMDDEEQRRFRGVEYVDCVLRPGDALYVPEGWWHYCRGLSVSFSVSFWWN